MAVKNSRFLGRLRRIIQKVRFLLSLNTNRWFLSSVVGLSPGPRRPGSKVQQGLLDCTTGAAEDYYEVGSQFGLSRTTSSTSGVSRTTSLESEISRTTSDASAGDDIDKRAEIFIANFYRHIQMERQVSLELRYCNEKTLESTRSD
ncbi:uncharacterized protein [Elaeis guineensis]|uniref:Uncharacterized protein LOC114913431 n=1 Tax=Elaeis guineensis var. tenera TaxID=51953 RepID=A0A8N4F283_ELAGV|nr:uncharacterized protein LOC114913431 [Elaeis guineensis]